MRQFWHAGTAIVCLGAGLGQAAWAADADAGRSADTLSLGAIDVQSSALASGDRLPAANYAGGQVASGGRLGILGEKQAIDVPFNVVSFTSELVDDQQADTVADVLVNDASVVSGLGFGNYAERYTIRGFELLGEDLAFGGLYGVLPRQIVATNFVERVELFKGANAFANGVPPTGSGVGGAVNLEPKRATDDPLTRLRVGYASDSYGETAIDAGRRFGENKQFGARVNLAYGDGDTAIDHEHRENISTALALDFRGERSRASLDAGYQKQDIDGGRSIVRLGPDLQSVPAAPDAETNYTPEYTFSRLETVFGMLRGEYDVSDAWTVYAGIGANDTDELGEYASVTLDNANGDASVGRLGVPYEAQAFAGQGGVRGSFLTGPVSHSLNLGYAGFYRKTSSAFTFAPATPNNTNIYDPVNLDSPATTSASGDLDNPNVRSRTRADGVALSDTLGFVDDRVLLTLGARYQAIEVNNYSYEGVLDRDNRPDDDKISPVYGLVVKPWENVSLYANHIEALQPGDVAPNTANNPGVTIGIAESKQNEIGAKYAGSRFGGGIALFEIEQPNARLDDNGDFGYFGEQRNRGVELSFHGDVVDGLRLISSATWIDSKLQDTGDGTTEGNHAIGVPEYRLVVGGDWDLPGAPRWTVDGRVIRTGSQYVDDANDFEIDGWTRVDLGLQYRMPAGQRTVVWRARVENVADSDYWASAQGGYLTQGDPRTFKLSAMVDF
ncbi:TonB-dependent siderophore receptor [Salinisphaera sp. T31B1]|uniref:TonB-dependent receptor n=1 Tax=Salinisphaera sp. T31B1 TaxID=727963 RepID=UPI00333ECE26